MGADGLQLVMGTASLTQVHSGGYQIVGPGGLSTNTEIGQGGYEIVLDGGHTTNTRIDAGATVLLTEGALTAGNIDFAGSNGMLLIGGTTLPATTIDSFDLNGATGDAIVLAGFSYQTGHDTVSLSSGNVLNLDLNGQTEKLFLNPSQNYAGHHFQLTANSFGQVVITDPISGAAAVKAGLLSPPAGLKALDKLLLNTKLFTTLLDAGMSAGLSHLAGAGSFPALEAAAFSVLGPNLAAIGSFSSAH